MGKFENFKSEQELVGRIEQLRADGVNDNEITVFSNEALEGNSLNYTDVNFKSADGTAWDKFISFFTSEKPEERAIADLGLSEENKQDYMTALQAGDILLFVSEDVPDASQEKLDNDEEHTTNYQSDDDAVGGEPLDAGYRQEEKDPGLPGTSREEAVSNAAVGTTLSAGNERGHVREEEVNVDSRGISNQPGTNSDGSTREDKDVSDYGNEDTGSGARVTEMKPNQEYDTDDEAVKQDKDFEGTLRAEDSENNDEGIIRDEDIERDARVVDAQPEREYVTKETARTVDVSTYGYDDTENRDHIETSSDGGNALTDEDLEKEKANRDELYYSKQNDVHKNEPDRRNFNM